MIDLIVCHLIGDFVIQSAWMAQEKGKSWEVNFYHAIGYTVPFWFLGLSPVTLGFIAGSHFLIDPLKARYGIVKRIYEDQILHFVVLVFVQMYGR